MAIRHIVPQKDRLAIEREFIEGKGHNDKLFAVNLPMRLHHKLKELSVESGKTMKDLTIESLMDLINNKYGKH